MYTLDASIPCTAYIDKIKENETGEEISSPKLCSIWSLFFNFHLQYMLLIR